MTIKSIKERYKHYQLDTGHNSFVPCDFAEYGKVVIVVQVNPQPIGDYVQQVVRVSDGKELLERGRSRTCDSLEDAIDVAWEMLSEEA